MMSSVSSRSSEGILSVQEVEQDVDNRKPQSRGIPQTFKVDGEREVDISCLANGMTLSRAECEEALADVPWTREYLYNEVIRILKHF